jgi:hypothetical protein
VVDPLLRGIVLWSGCILLLLGVLVIAGLPWPASWRGFTTLVWLALCVRELRNLAAAYRQYRALRIHADGSIELRQEDDEAASARLLPGSIVLPGLAWLRLELEDGSASGELLRGNTGEDEAWRRLQVIWRHLGAAR